MFILLTPDQLPAQKIDHSLDHEVWQEFTLGRTPYMEKRHTLSSHRHRTELHTIKDCDFRQTESMCGHYTTATEIWDTELIGTNGTPDKDRKWNTGVESLTFAASARIVKHQSKQQHSKRVTVTLTPQDAQPNQKLKKGYHEVKRYLTTEGNKTIKNTS